MISPAPHSMFRWKAVVMGVKNDLSPCGILENLACATDTSKMQLMRSLGWRERRIPISGLIFRRRNLVSDQGRLRGGVIGRFSGGWGWC